MTKTIPTLIENRFGVQPEAGAEQASVGQLTTLLERRTHRQYTEQPIEDDLLDVLLACGLSASSKSDLQQASVVIIDDVVTRAEIGSWIPTMPWIVQAPRFLVFCADHSRTRLAAKLRKKPFPNDNVDQFMNAAVDAALVMQTFILAAESVGLGCCPISEVRSHIEALSELLALPDYVFPIAGLCVGYPARAGYVSMRLPQALTVHRERYSVTDQANLIDAYDRARDARFSIPEQSQREIDRFGVAEFYGWSEDKARQYSTPHRAGFLAYLKARGFAME
ncbi:MAG: nitroreductase family protein [Pseudomonadales bacterium]|nr:nitroreductase family protein [Pseudomonadales bacterium]